MIKTVEKIAWVLFGAMWLNMAHYAWADDLNTDEGKGLQMMLFNQPYTTKLGLIYRQSKAQKLFPGRPDAEFDQLPTMGLAAEHWWKSFEMLMKCQREYALAVDQFKRHQTAIAGPSVCLLDDPECGGELSWAVVVIREYWVPFVALPTSGTKQEFIDHFKAGLFGANGCIDHLRNIEEANRWFEINF